MLESHNISRPYPGLRPFETWEGEIFFGREEHTNRLLDILKERHFLAVIGPSGSGKSSLVRAGLLPSLPLGSLGTGSEWRLAIMRPGNRPIRSLAHTLLSRSALGTELVGEDRIPADELTLSPEVALIEAELKRGPLGLVDIVQDARKKHADEDDFNLLLLVDQFEELFTYSEVASQNADEAEAFVNLLLAPPELPNARIYIVITMRTDFLGNCVRFLDLPDAINRAQYLTPRLTREQIERAITCPAYLFDGKVDPTLVTELINAASNDSDQLPVLQHALSRMWDQAFERQQQSPSIVWNDFTAVGGLSNALSLHADEILAQLSPSNRIEQPLSREQHAAADLFRAITEQRRAESGGQAVRKPQSLERIAKWSGKSWQDFIPVINAYSKEGVNFLHINSAISSDTVIDISHEALIRQWRRLRKWVNQETRLVSEYERFRTRASDYKKNTGALLTGADLERALEWRNGTLVREISNDIWQPNANWASRYRKTEDPSAYNEFQDILTFIEKSQAVVISAKKRARIIKRALASLTVLSLITTLGAFGFAFQSYHNQIKAEASLLWNPLDFSTPVVNVTDKQSKGLFKLALANAAQKQGFVVQLLEDQALAERFINNPEAIVSAIVGINPQQRENLLKTINGANVNSTDVFRLTRFILESELEADISIDDILSAITITDNTELPARKSVSRYIKTLINNMQDADLEIFSHRLLATFNDPLNQYENEPRNESLLAVIERLSPDKLARMAEHLTGVISRTSDPQIIETLKQTLATIADKLPTNESLVSNLLDQLLKAIETSSVLTQIDALSKALEKLSPKISAVQAEALANKLSKLINTSASDLPFKALGQSLSAVNSQLPAQNPNNVTLANQLIGLLNDATLPEQFDAIGLGLLSMAQKLPPFELEHLTNHLFEAIKSKETFKIFRHEGLQENDIARFKTLGLVLATFIKEMPENQAENLVTPLLSAIKMPLDAGQFNALGQGLAEAAAKLPPPKADHFAKELLSTMAEVKDSNRINALSDGMVGVAKQMSATQTEVFAQKLISEINKLAQKNNYVRFDALSKALAALTAKTSTEHASALTKQMISAVMASENRLQTTAFGAAVANAAGNIPASMITQEAVSLITIFKDANDTQLKVLVKALESMIKDLPEKQTLMVLEPLLATLQNLRDDLKDDQTLSKIKTTGKAIKAVASTSHMEQVQSVIDSLLAAINNSKSSEKQEALGHGLAIATANSSTNQAIALTQSFMKQMQQSQSLSHYKAIGRGLTTAIEKLPENQKILATQLLEIILQTQNVSQREVLSQVLNLITETASPDDQDILKWFELLKNPVTPRRIMADALVQKLPWPPQSTLGFWPLIKWSKLRYPNINLETENNENLISKN